MVQIVASAARRAGKRSRDKVAVTAGIAASRAPRAVARNLFTARPVRAPRTIARRRTPRRRAPDRAAGSRYWVSGFPELVAEWHPTRNGDLRPDDVSHGSGRKIWWKCGRGPDHEWRASANNRVAGRTGCPFCAGRLPSVTNTLATLRPDLALQWHPTRNPGATPDQVVAGSERPRWWKCPLGADHEWRVSPHARIRNEGACPFCLRLRVSRASSLAALEPSVAAEWHPTRNRDVGPGDVVPGSSRVFWWRCGRAPAHEWRASVANRCRRGSRCPFCAGRRASAEHCLAVAFPEIAAEWHPTRNAGLTPRDVTPRSHTEAWWRCPVGHEWRCRVRDRTRRGQRCPNCTRAARQAARPDRTRET